MVLFHIILATLLLPFISTKSDFRANQTKSKRTIADQTFSNENGKAVVFYMENPQTSDIPELQAAASSSGIRNFYSGPSKPLALVSVQQPIQVFEQDSPKQVAAQQVLYEFQQTPTNAESNVHVKQLFQPNVEFTTRTPLYQNQQIEQLPTNQPLSSIHSSTPVITGNQHLGWSQPQAAGLVSGSSYHPATSESIVSPVHHNIYTNHALDSASFSSYNPLLPPSQQYQNTIITPKQTPGKYIYLNGKIVYHPSYPGQGQQGLSFPQNNIYNKGVYHNQQKLPLLNNGGRHNRPSPQGGIVYGNPIVGKPFLNRHQQPGNFPPITIPRFQPPKQVQQIDKPSSRPQQHGESEEEDEKPVNETSNEGNEEEDEGGEREEEESDFEDDDDHYLYGDFSLEDDEYSDEEDIHPIRPSKSRKNRPKNKNHEEENEEEHEDDRRDTRGGASKQNSKYNNSNRNIKYRMPPKYDANENYAYGEKYSSNMKYKTPTNKYNGNIEKPQGQFKKYQYSKKPGGKPKIKKIEGRFSELVPVTHKHKMYKERWFVSKDIEGPNKGNKYIK